MKPKKQPCATLRGCLQHLDRHWLTPGNYSLGAVTALGEGKHRVVVLNKRKQEALVVTIHHAGPEDWDIGAAVWEIQTFVRSKTRGKVASSAECVK